MALAFGSFATGQTGTNSRTLTWTHVVEAGTDLLVVAMAANGDNSDNRQLSSVTVNGVAATLIPGSQFFSSGGGVARWIEGAYLAGALSGTVTITATYNSAGSTATIVGHSATFSGSNQTMPLGTADGASGSTSPISATVSSATGGLVFSALGQRTSAATGFPAGATATRTDSQTSGGVYASVAIQPGASSVTASYTTPAANHAMFAVPINAATGSSPAPAVEVSASLSGEGTLTAVSTASSTGGSTGSTGGAPTLVSPVAVTELGSGTTVAAAMPTGVQAGHFLIAALGQKGSTATYPVTPPTGWTQVAAYQSGTAGEFVFTKWATASEPATYTFTAGVTDGVTVEISAWSGVDPTTPLDTAPTTSSATSGTSIATPTITTVTSNTLVLYSVIGQTTGSSMSADPALTEVADTTGTGRRIVQATEVMATPGTTPARTFTSSTSFQKAAITLALRPAPSGGGGGATPSGPTPALVSRLVGIPAPGVSATVAVDTTDASSVRLKVGTDQAVSQNVVWGDPATPNSQGVAMASVSGLAPGTYYYRVAMKDAGGAETLDTSSTVGRLKVAPVGQTSFGFNFGSCTNATDSAALAAIAARGDDLFIHLGDLYYADGSGTDLANFRAKMAAKITAPNHAAVLATTPTVYTPSDHDGMNNNSDAGDDPTAWANWNTAFRENFPAPVPPGSGAYHTFVWGRVRFIVWDDRTFKSDKDLADSASKTALGATQKAWFKAVLSAATEPLIIIAQSSPWIDTSTASEDGWGGYITERNEIGDFIAASGKNVVMLGGDMHAVAADDGTSVNARGIGMMLQAAPFYNSASQKGGPYKVAPYPTGSGTVQQYGHVDITDAGDSITVAFQGLSSDNTQRVALSKTFSLVPPPAIEVSAALSGEGTLTANSTPATRTSAALTGSGTLTSASTVATRTSAALSGDGSLTAASRTATRVSAGLSGDGVLTAVSKPSVRVAAALTGDGNLSAVAGGVARTSGAFSGEGTLSAVPTVATRVSTALSGTGTLTATSRVATRVSVALAGAGDLSAVATASTPTPVPTTGGVRVLSRGTWSPISVLRGSTWTPVTNL